MSGCGSVWLERCVRDAEAGGSNPLTPTIFLPKKWSTKTQVFSSRFYAIKVLHSKTKFFFASLPIPEVLLVKTFRYRFTCEVAPFSRLWSLLPDGSKDGVPFLIVHSAKCFIKPPFQMKQLHFIPLWSIFRYYSKYEAFASLIWWKSALMT